MRGDRGDGAGRLELGRRSEHEGQGGDPKTVLHELSFQSTGTRSIPEPPQALNQAAEPSTWHLARPARLRAQADQQPPSHPVHALGAGGSGPRRVGGNPRRHRILFAGASHPRCGAGKAAGGRAASRVRFSGRRSMIAKLSDPLEENTEISTWHLFPSTSSPPGGSRIKW
jgi:hypothetical protein